MDATVPGDGAGVSVFPASRVRTLVVPWPAQRVNPRIIRPEVYDAVARINAGRLAEAEMRRRLAENGLSVPELQLFVDAAEKEPTR